MSRKERGGYEEVERAQWFKDAYHGQSLGDVIRVHAATPRSEMSDELKTRIEKLEARVDELESLLARVTDAHGESLSYIRDVIENHVVLRKDVGRR